MIKRKIIYLISDIEKALAFEWIAQHLSEKHEVIFILISRQNTPLIRFLEALSVRCAVISDDDYPGSFKKWIKVLTVFKKERPDIIHIHMWKAMLLGLTASFLLGIKKRIFTRHYSVPHYVSNPSGRKWDMLCNRLATDIVAISKNVENVLINMDGVNPSKVHLIHHGFDIAYFQLVEKFRVERLRVKYNLDTTKGPIIGVISRYLELKGIQFIIPAFKELRKKFPQAHLVLANSRGDFESQIREMLADIPSENFTEILFEEDLAALYKLFDVFVHVPIDLKQEAFGQTYVEALAAGVPSVFSLSGVAPEFVIHEVNALVVPHGDARAIENEIIRILENPSFATALTERGIISIKQFSLDGMLSKLDDLYA